jgi:hypothetical protein
MPQKVSQLLTAEARVRSRAIPGEVPGRRGTRKGFSPSTSGPLFQNRAHNAPHSFLATPTLPGNTQSG